jgi:hypothetical protein
MSSPLFLFLLGLPCPRVDLHLGLLHPI